MQRPRRQQVGRAVLGLLVLAAAASGGWWYAHQWPKRFAPVVEGRLYRSGEVTPAQLARLQREHGITRVVSLLDGNAPVSVAERAAAQNLGIRWCNIPLPGDGASTSADRAQILQLLSDPNAPPTLVHCSAGTNRTGLAVGLYRLHCQHWTLDQVLAEMRRFDFADLPKHENLRAALAVEAADEQAAPATTTAENTPG